MEPNKIKVYAIQTTRFSKGEVTKHGWGHSTLLKTPEVDISYRWQGKLYGSKKDIVSSSNTRGDIADLAENLADNIKNHPSSQYNQSEVPAYSLNYHTKRKTEKWPDFITKQRPLTWKERRLFDKALKASLGKNKNLTSRLFLFISLGVLIFGLLFLSSNLTGNVISNLNKLNSNIIGTILFTFGIIGSFFWFKKYKN